MILPFNYLQKRDIVDLIILYMAISEIHVYVDKFLFMFFKGWGGVFFN